MGKAERGAIGSLIHIERGKTASSLYNVHWIELVNLLIEALTADVL